jgi:hypothetical protein
MKCLLQRLWSEEDGFVLSSEMVLYGTLGVVGVGAGYTAMRDSINTELSDVAKAIGSIDQSFWYSPVIGHSAWTAGSSYFDRADLCDGPTAVPVEAPRCDKPVVCADVFGRGTGPQSHDVPRVEPRPRPDSLPGRGAAVPRNEPPKQDAPRPAVAAPSKSVVVAEPGPARVVGSPMLAPCNPLVGEGVSVMINPWHGGPHLIDVPEGYWNRHPVGAFAPHYRVLVEGHHGRHDYGYAYAPAHHHASPVHHVAPDRRSGWDTIDLGFAKVGDDDLKDIEKFDDAKCLHVLGSNVTDKGLGYICEMDDLESLHLVGTQITDGGLRQLRELKKLRFLHLVGTKITDHGLAQIANLKQLEELDVRGTPVTEEGLARLKKELPTLRVIR